MPYAYKCSDEDPLILIPDPDMVPAVEEAMDYLDEGHPYRAVAEWLSNKTGVPISHQGISIIWKRHRSSKPSAHMKKLKADARKRRPKTKAEKEEQEARFKLRAAKRNQTVFEKKLARMEKGDEEATDAGMVMPAPVPTVSEQLDHDAEPAASEVVFRPNPGPQTEFLAAPEKEVLYGGAAGGGKLVRKGGLVLTPFGYKKIEDLKVGSRINAPDGTTQKIIQLHPWVRLQGVRVHFHDGAYTDVAWDHLWLAWRSGVQKKRPQGQKEFGEGSAEVVETRDLKAWLDKALAQQEAGQRPNWPLIPVCKPQVFNVQRPYKTDLDPYQLGYWLGDGHVSGENGKTNIGFTTEDIDHFYENFGYEDVSQFYRNESDTVAFILKHDRRRHWMAMLKRCKLDQAKSLTKFVPEEFLYGSIETRTAILQGLMDTDGYADERGQLYFTTISEQLSNDVKFLVQSLGGTATVTSKIATCNGQDHNRAYTAYIKLPNTIQPFRLDRKLARLQGSDLLHRRVVKIEEIEEIEGRCITVSHPSRCYITNDFIVTHNSYALISDPMRYFDHADFIGLILRRTNDELRELIWKTQEMYPKAFPGAKWQEKKSQWVFPSGARLWMTYLERDEDVLRYQGLSFSYIGWDELTQHPTPFAYNYMRSRLRTTDPTLPTFIRATTNPGGPGMGWVKKMFIDPAPPNKAFAATDIDTGEVLRYPDSHANAGKPLFYRRFIPASLYDNPYLTADGAYEANLLSLPEMQRRQLLEGDWNIATGAAFPEFRVSTHTIEPFEIPHDWRRFRSCDFGYSSHSAVHWFAIDPNFGTLYVYRELYVSKHTGRDLAKAVIEAEKGEQIDYGMLDSSCWHQRGQIGPSIAEEMISVGCKWRPSDRSAGSRVAGKNRLHELLKVDPQTDKPSILFFNNCRQIIADLPVIPSDPKGGDDIDVRYASDHAFDSLRYGIMSRPRARSPFDDFGKYSQQNKYRPADAAFGY